MTTNKFNEERTFGVEIEFKAVLREEVAARMNEKGVPTYVEHYNHSTRDHWKVITDSSCGYELVSPILKGREGLRQLELACEALNELGAKVNRTCGLHVHHDINDYSVEDTKNLYATYIKFEKIIDSFLPNSRRGDNNRFCKSLTSVNYSKTEQSVLESLQRTKTMDDIKSLFSTRYLKLNIQSYVKYGTIEFRQHSGTTEYEKIYNWIILTQQMVDNAMVRKVNFKYSDKWNTMSYFADVMNMTKAKGATDEVYNTLKWYRARAKQLAAA